MEDPHGEHVIVMKSGDGETFDILIDEDIDSGDMKRKRVKVIVSDDEHATWHVDGKDLEQWKRMSISFQRMKMLRQNSKRYWKDHEGDERESDRCKEKIKKAVSRQFGLV